MKTYNPTSKKLFGGLFAAVLSIAFPIASVSAQEVVDLNFASLDTSAGPVSGAPLTNYFASYGITLSSVTANTTVDVRAGTPAEPAPAGTNLLSWGGGSEYGVGFTMNFSQPVSQLSFLRGEYNPIFPR